MPCHATRPRQWRLSVWRRRRRWRWGNALTVVILLHDTVLIGRRRARARGGEHVLPTGAVIWYQLPPSFERQRTQLEHGAHGARNPHLALFTSATTTVSDYEGIGLWRASVISIGAISIAISGPRLDDATRLNTKVVCAAETLEA